MKILILVQGCDDAPYDKIQQAQINTWYSIKVPEVNTKFYISTPDLAETRQEGNKIYVPCSKSYDMMHWRYKLTLDHIWDWDWDYIFRSNTSSYIDKRMLLQKALTLPKERCYCGVKGGDNMASGCGVFLSRDVVKIFKEEFDSHPTPAEDCLMGTYCQRHGIPVTEGAQRYDYHFHVYYDGVKRHDNYHELPNIYHYRCISDTKDRNKDIEAFNKIHKMIHG